MCWLPAARLPAASLLVAVTACCPLLLSSPLASVHGCYWPLIDASWLCVIHAAVSVLQRCIFSPAAPTTADAASGTLRLVCVMVLIRAGCRSAFQGGGGPAVVQGEVHLHLWVVPQHPAGHWQPVEVGVEPRIDRPRSQAGFAGPARISVTADRLRGRAPHRPSPSSSSTPACRIASSPCCSDPA